MHEELTIRLATPDDCKRVFDLSNDPIVRANSIHSETIKWEEHCVWFQKHIHIPLLKKSFTHYFHQYHSRLPRKRISLLHYKTSKQKV